MSGADNNPAEPEPPMNVYARAALDSVISAALVADGISGQLYGWMHPDRAETGRRPSRRVVIRYAQSRCAQGYGSCTPTLAALR